MYKTDNLDYITILNDSNNNHDKSLVNDDMKMVDKIEGCRLAKVLNSYFETQDYSNKNNLNIWEWFFLEVFGL